MADRQQDQGAPWWRDAATGIALAGLVVTMVFNTIGVWQQVAQSKVTSRQATQAAAQARQTRQDTQITLLTELNALAGESDRRISLTRLPEARCAAGYDPSRREAAAIAAAVQYYDFLAWLFNERHVTMDSAKRYWTPSMLEAQDLAATFFGLAETNRRYPELARFKRSLSHLKPPACR